MYIQGERLGGAVRAMAFTGWVRRVRFKGHLQVCVCVCVLVRAVIAERSWQVGWFLLEKDALSFLHPRVVLHQLRVQKGILWDAVLYPLYQALWRDTEKLHFSNSRGSLLPQSILSFPYKARKRWRLRATRGQKLLIILTSTTVDFWVLFGKSFI